MGLSLSNNNNNNNNNNAVKNNNNNNNQRESSEVEERLEKDYCYSSHNTPVGIQNFDIDEDLLNYLTSLDIFTCDEKTLQKRYRFNNCVDYPHLKDHIYYEGYFHSMRTEEAMETINPRRGARMPKLPAPKSLRAFFIAFREKNREYFQNIVNSLEETQNETAVAISNFFKVDGEQFERIIGDLAIQVHHGSEVKGDYLGWHVDGRNSLFHMAVSIHGRRALHSMRSKQKLVSGERLPRIYEWQNVGNIYISSPALFLHAVQYPESTWDSRTIAIQARFLLNSGDNAKLNPPSEDPNDKLVFGEIIAAAFRDNRLLLPTLNEVLEVENSLLEFDYDADYDPSLVVNERILRFGPVY